MKVINQHSFLLTAATLILLAAFFIFRDGFSLPRALGLVALAGAVAGLWLAVRPRQSAALDISRVEEHIGGDIPVLLEFQSPY